MSAQEDLNSIVSLRIQAGFDDGDPDRIKKARLTSRTTTGAQVSRRSASGIQRVVVGQVSQMS